MEDIRYSMYVSLKLQLETQQDQVFLIQELEKLSKRCNLVSQSFAFATEIAIY
jgi:hypothetical protein